MVYIFKIQIKNIKKPPVWRRVAVPATYSFSKFHEVIQDAFGWENRHLYQFSPKGYGSEPVIGVPGDSDFDFFDTSIEDSSKIKLKAVFKEKGEKFVYIYDFGDDWEHTILLEDILETKALKAELLMGKGMCPPEDVGGPWGYAHFLEAIANPNHEEYESLREWMDLEEGDEWITTLDKETFLFLADDVRRV